MSAITVFPRCQLMENLLPHNFDFEFLWAWYWPRTPYMYSQYGTRYLRNNQSLKHFYHFYWVSMQEQSDAFQNNYLFQKVESSWRGVFCAILKIRWRPRLTLRPGHIKFGANYSTLVVSSAATDDFSFCIWREENHIAL